MNDEEDDIDTTEEDNKPAVEPKFGGGIGSGRCISGCRCLGFSSSGSPTCTVCGHNRNDHW